MAGDWLKIEKATARKPEILRLSVALGVRPDEAFGLCFRFWAWCDDQVTNGRIDGLTENLIDATVDRLGFAQSLIEVGWLQVRQGSLVVPNFDRHLSHSAKTRAEAAIRKRKERVANVTKMSQKNVTSVAESRDKNVTLEKRREEKREETPSPFLEYKPPDTIREVIETVVESCGTAAGDRLTFQSTAYSDSFNRFIEVFPRHKVTTPKKAWDAWQRVLTEYADANGLKESTAAGNILAAVTEFAKSPLGKSQFCPNPVTWLDGWGFDAPRESWQEAKEQKSSTVAPLPPKRK